MVEHHQILNEPILIHKCYMNSFISLLWQFEIPNLPIATTILKNQHEGPHHYFYSNKQNRVLRKKNPNALALIEQSCKKQGCNILQIRRENKKKQIQINICQSLTAIESLSNIEFEGQFCIVEPKSQILRFCKPNCKQNAIEVEYLNCDPSVQNYERELNNFVDKICSSLAAELQKKNELLKLSKQKLTYSIKYIQLILAVNPSIQMTNKHKFVIIQGIKLQFEPRISNIIQIWYEPIQPKIKTSRKQERQLNLPRDKQLEHVISNPKSSNLQKQEFIENEGKAKEIQSEQRRKKMQGVSQQKKQGVKKVCQCCCQNKLEQFYKQISKQNFVSLRKSKGQPIRGFNEQYYQVCVDCYMLV